MYFAVPEWIKTYWDYPLVQKAKEDLTYQVPQGRSCVGQFVLLLVSRLHGLCYAVCSMVVCQVNRDSPEEKVLDFYDRMIILTKVRH